MPIYEFQCDACSHEFEELVRSMRSTEQVHCPSCGDERIRRKLSLFAAGQSETSVTGSAPGGCGRCGDPNGPCAMP